MLPVDAGDVEDPYLTADRHVLENQLRRLRRMPAKRWDFYPTNDYPATDRRHHVWYSKVPTSQNVINRSPIAQRAMIRALIATVRVLRRNRPTDAAHHRVVAMIDIHDFHGSEIAVFFDDDYYRWFRDRTSHYQTWTPLPPHRSLCAEWQIPSDLAGLGFVEVINDEDLHREGEIWLLGDVGRY